MKRKLVFFLFATFLTLSFGCGEKSTNVNVVSSSNAANKTVTVVNTNANATPASVEEKIKAIQDESNAKREQVLENANKRADDSYERQKADAKQRNDELRRKIEEQMQNSNR